jgi:capsular exopolysaccharide synthesis family protein
MRDDASEASITEMLHLRDYWRTVRKRIWTLITAFLLIVGSVTVVTLLTPPVYQSSASLQVDAQPQGYNNIAQLGQYGSGQYMSDQEYYATQHKKLRARIQARAVFERLQLGDHPDFKDSDDPIQDLLDAVDVEPVPKTRLVWVYVRSNDRNLAEEICAAWTELFVQRNMDELNQGVKDGLEWMEKERDKAAERMRDAEHALLEFRKQNNRIALSTEEKQNVVTSQIEELSREQAEASAQAARARAEHDSLVGVARKLKDPQQLSLVVDSPLMESLRAKFGELRTEKQALSDRKGPLHPEMKEVDTRAADVESQIHAEVNAEIGRRKAMLELAEGKERGIEATIERITASALNDSEEAEYNLLRQQKESAEQIYSLLTDKIQEMGVTTSLKENNVRIIDPAEAKDDPVEPNYARNILVAILAGLLAGVSLALFFDYMDTTIKTREEVEALGIPFLGIIPSVPGLQGEGWDVARERYLYAANYPKSAFAEFCRNIRTSVNFSAREDGKPPRRLLITSAGPREGKTTSSINLGITFAATGRRVCLVDADLRRPSLHHAFGKGNELGFSSLINNTHGTDAVVQATPQEGLFVVPSGPRPPNPAELLGSAACRAALDRLNDEFDLVIIDSPPVVAVTDAVVLSADVDGVILVIKSFKVARDLVLQAKRMLKDVEAHVIGVILNDFDIQRKSYGYYYYYTYYGAEREDVGRKRRKTATDA